MDLNQKDIHCMARIVQSSVFANGQIFYGCQYCKYWNDGCEEYVNSKAKSGTSLDGLRSPLMKMEISWSIDRMI